jgi:nitroreductase
MELLEGIATRRSVRGFKSTPVPAEVMDKILRAVANSPSYTNTQPWEVAVVSGSARDELGKIIHDLARAKAPTTPDLPVPAAWPAEMEARFREHGARRLKTLGIARDDEDGRERLRLMNFEFYGAPCIILLFADRSLGEWSVFDMGLCAQSLILAAHGLGMGTVLQASVVNYADAIRQFLGIPSSKRLVICIAIGYPDESAKLNDYRALKQEPEDFTNWYT